jgi:hypothetical protein
MATNTNQNRRNGAVRDRSQSYNCNTGNWQKRDRNSGQFLSGSPARYKGVREE